MNISHIEVVEKIISDNFQLCIARINGNGILNMLYAADVQLQNRFKAALVNGNRLRPFAEISSVYT